MRVLAAFVLATLPIPATAQMLPGADDPAYRAAMTAALAADDPQAMADLHRLAEGGNAAATVALATVSGWYTVGTTLAERRVFRFVGGVPVSEAASAVHPAFALWSGYDQVPAPEILVRAEGLIAAGEVRKGTTALATWLNMTGALVGVPQGYWSDLPVQPWSRALALVSRLGAPRGPAAEDLAILATWLDDDRPEGWLVLDMLESGGTMAIGDGRARLLDTVISARMTARDPAEVASRQGTAAALRDLLMGRATPDTVEADAMDGLAALLSATGSDLPIRLWCKATCPASTDTCTTAAVAAFGLRPVLTDGAAPMVAALPLTDFYASPRGQYQVLSAGFMAYRAAPGDPEAISVARRGPAMTRARDMDACFAAAVDAALPDLVTRRFAR